MSARLSLLLSLLAACAATPPGTGPSTGTPPPTAWLGTWRGGLTAPTTAGARELTTMELRIEPIAGSADRRWCLTYGSGERADVRDYRLQTVDAATGDYAIDEQNGIVLPLLQRGEALVSVFAVQGSTLVVRYVWRGDAIDFELESFAERDAQATGQQVQGWPKVSVQRARLRRATD